MLKNLISLFILILLVLSCSDNNNDSELAESPCIEADYVSFKTSTSLTSSRGYGSSTFLNNNIYISRGAKLNIDGVSNSRTSDIIRYDTNNETWSEITNDLISLRYGDIEIYNSKIYLLNGDISGGGLNNSVEVFDLTTNELKILNGINPYPVRENGSDIWKFHNIIFFGGTDENGDCSDKIVKYNLNDNSFELIGNLPVAICNTKGQIINDKLYIIAGYLGSEVLNKILVYDLNNNSLIDEISIPVSISAHTTSKYKDKIFIKGDYNIQNLFAVFDTDDNSFRIIESDVANSRHLMSEIVNGKFYVFGGNTTSQFSTMTDKVQYLDLDNEGYFCYD